MKKVVKKLFQIILFITVTILILEGATRILLSIDPIFSRVLDFESHSERLRWVKGHQDSQVEIQYSFDLYDPTKGWRAQSNLIDETAFNNKILNTNSQGLRGKIDYSFENPTDKKRILVLGDSFTFGDEVSDTETYPYHLQELLPQTEVINFGVHGYGHDQMLIFFNEEGVKYKPDIVILGFVYQDLLRNIMNFKDFAKPEFKLVDGKLVLTNTPVPTPEQVLAEEVFKLKFLDLLAVLQYRVSWQMGTKKTEMKQVSTAILDELIETIKEVGALPVFVYLPEDENKQLLDGEEFFTEYCASREINCFNLQPYFIANIPPGEDYKEYGGHYNSLGNYVVAQGISEYLIEQAIVE